MNRNRSALTLQHRKEIIDFTIKKRLPGMFVAKEWVTVGGLMSYGENLSDMYHRGAYFVDKILKGAKPADLPVEQVTKFELVLNLNTAKGHRVEFPTSLPRHCRRPDRIEILFGAVRESLLGTKRTWRSILAMSVVG